MVEKESTLNARLQALFDIYQEIKPIVLQAEYYNKEYGYIPACANEIRNSFDHLMRNFADGKLSNYELQEAEAHLYRAGYDAYEIIAINCIRFIEGITLTYSSGVLTDIYSEYFTRVSPLITKSKKELANSRAKKKDLDSFEKEKNSFGNYETIVNSLMDEKDKIEALIPAFEKHKKELKRKNILIGIVYAAVAGIITGVVILLFSNHK